MKRFIPPAVILTVVALALAAVFTAVGVVPFNGENPLLNTSQDATADGLGVASFETSAGAAYDAKAYTITRWGTIGLEASNEDERLAFPWAAITRVELEAP